MRRTATATFFLESQPLLSWSAMSHISLRTMGERLVPAKILRAASPVMTPSLPGSAVANIWDTMASSWGEGEKTDDIRCNRSLQSWRKSGTGRTAPTRPARTDGAGTTQINFYCHGGHVHPPTFSAGIRLRFSSTGCLRLFSSVGSLPSALSLVLTTNAPTATVTRPPSCHDARHRPLFFSTRDRSRCPLGTNRNTRCPPSHDPRSTTRCPCRGAAVDRARATTRPRSSAGARRPPPRGITAGLFRFRSTSRVCSRRPSPCWLVAEGWLLVLVDLVTASCPSRAQQTAFALPL